MHSRFEDIVRFIRQTYKQPDSLIPLHEPKFAGNEKKYLNECIDSTFVSSIGKFVDRFEEDIANYTGAKKSVACVNGTNALHLALILAGVEQNDEIITQPLTFVATANAISYCMAKPIFVDVDKDTLGLSPASLLEFLETQSEQKNGACFNKTSHKRISVCVPVHTFGHPCRIDEIVEICNKFNIKVVEDAAESVGSFYKNKHTGTFADIGVLSFNGNKIITTGGGGVLLFNDLELGNKAKHLSTQAKVAHPWEYIHDKIGYNYRMPNINAALGVAQFEEIEKHLASKRKLASCYKTFFNEIDIPFFTEPPYTKSNYWLNAIFFNDKSERNAFLQYSNNSKVIARPAWTLMNQTAMYKNAQRSKLTNAEWLSDRIVNIPSSAV